MPNGQYIMGNYDPPSKMSTFQQYTGMGPYQYDNHISKIPISDRSNFYSKIA
jgi:hypothetical protein